MEIFMALKNKGNLFWKQINELPCIANVPKDIKININGYLCNSLNEFLKKWEEILSG